MSLPYRDINVHAAPDSYTFTSPSSPNAPALTIDRPTGDIRLTEGNALSGKRVQRVSSIAGILGIISLRLDKYVIIITKAQPAGRLKGHMVYRIVSTDLLPLRERQIRDAEEDRFLTLVRAFIKDSPMYFSYSVDLTNSFQRQSQHGNNTPLWMRADDRFFWNRFVQTDLINFRYTGSRANPGAQKDVDPFILPVMFGMLEIHRTHFKNTPITLALITRRSRFRAGTRYLNRGLDAEGHAANYNETEQVLVMNDSGDGLGGFAGSSDMQSGKMGGGKEMQIFSYVQTRGSIPAFWAEVNALKYTPKLQVKSIEAALPAAAAHFREQVQIYGDNYLVNLVNQKGREKAAKEAYEEVVQRLSASSTKERTVADQRTDEKFHTIEPTNAQNIFDRLHYIYFDFHAETKGNKLHRAQLLLDQLKDVLEAQGYFCATESAASALDGKMEVRTYQTSVVRSNCMDCLDRTNVVQSILGRHKLDRMFISLGLMAEGRTFKDEDPQFEFLFRNLWADNADMVSKSYAGTGAMKTDMTRMGIRTKAGALQDGNIAITRYFRNNFLDGPRQDSFDIFLGAYQPAAAANIGSGLIFADRRPLLIQAIPYIMGFSSFLVFVALFTKRMPDAAVMPLRLFTLFFFAVSAWCAYFIINNGILYVNWPKLNPRPWAQEGYQDTTSKIRRDKIIGPFVAKHERGLSTARYISAEEGKKRVE
ncbi:recessive suppressor of secretory defect [Pyricularia oryzae]|uniref:Recessive suppressor of secretory defect n=2 Tax=Pyricularia oryzae TaxID=318829 RepID=A0AA97P0R9_PYRO3|nr:recessive suppressor of secretory defect [Pyricularia oryzae Y34]KAI7929462.1 recessive suppressor of secretory defect [Pyricularia oryzae]